MLFRSEICGWIITKDIFSGDESGIVIAGFGKKDIFPSLIALHVESIIFRKLKYKMIEKRKIGLSNPSEIIPFAQGDMVSTFITGASPSYKQTMQKRSKETLQNWRDKFKEVAAASTEVKSAIDMMESEMKGLLRDLNKSMEEHCRKEEQLIKAAVDSLSKDELAATAESLVHLTSLKRKMSLETESVGGPVDVAVISKGDGFIWIKRKHYFDPELNHQFFENYFIERK